MVVHTYNLSIQEAKAGESQVQGWLRLQSKFEAALAVY
jgi:hypothetical protein